MPNNKSISNELSDSVLKNAFDKMFNREPKYLCFHDKLGILEGGLWVLFEQSTSCVLKVLHDPEFGDIMLCIDTEKSYDEVEHSEPNPDSIIGFAIISHQEPEGIGECLNDYWVRIKRKLPDITGYNQQVYTHILEKLQNCKLLIKKGLTMQKGGPQLL